MDFTPGPTETEWRDRVRAFMDAEVRPRVEDYDAQQREGERWKVLPIVKELKAKARADGLWNLFMPPSHGAAPVDSTFARSADYAADRSGALKPRYVRITE